MGATPAWPPASTPRLFVDQPLGEGLLLPLDGAPANYLGNVLRRGEGAPVRLFDDRSGEWLAIISEAAKRRITLRVERHLHVREDVPDLWLLFAPIKKAPLDWLVEKATELGAARLQPVVTARTVVERVNLDRLRAVAIEAAEQCDRTALPTIAAPATLRDVLRDWPAGRQLLFADETGGVPLGDVARPGPAAILIGPEGGFTPDERETIRACGATAAITLGPRILRAETAALAALAAWMAAVGDWSLARAPAAR